MTKQQVIVAIANVLKSKYRDYLVSGSEAAADLLDTEEKAFLDTVRADPFRYTISDYQDYVDGTLDDYTARYRAAKDAIASELTATPTAPTPAGTEVVGPASEIPGLVGTSRPGVTTDFRPPPDESIEPGELAMPSREQIAEFQASQAYAGAAGVTGVARDPGMAPTTTAAVSDGGDGNGVGGVGDVAVAPPVEDVMLPEDWEKAAEEQYGAYWAIFKYNPELKQILLDATMEDWSDTKFRAELEQTNWWKTTTQSARQFDMEEATDPATVQTKIDNRAAELQQIARTQGVTLSAATAAQIARDSLRGGWNYQTYSTAVTSEAVKSTAGLSQLRAGKIGQDIRETAASYGISLSDTEINSYVNKFAVGEESNVSFEGKMREFAKVLYPSISNQIDAGSTFTDIVAPYRSKAAAILELNPDQIDFMDSKYLAAITKTNDKGEQSMMNAREWEQELRTNREFGYEFTQQAQSNAYSVADQIANLFGRV